MLFATILLGGLLPILIYLVQYRGLGNSTTGTLQAVTPSEHLALRLSLFNIKPLYMFLCVALLIILWGRTSLPARALFCGFTALLAGELICGGTFAAFRRELIVSEHIHSYGMMLEFTFIVFALLEFLDRRGAPNQSRIRPMFTFLAIIGISASFLPLSVSTAQSGYHADIFGFPYTYIRFAFNQWVESRFLPITSLCCFTLTVITTRDPKPAGLPGSAKIFFSLGVGLLTFSMLRLTLGALFVEHLVWFEFWEEAIQLILISTITATVYQFKRGWIMERVELFRSAR